VVNPVIVNGKPISSSRIRRLISGHKLSQALEMLGHPYPIAGKVEKGIGLGKKIGYPTANICLNSRKLLPTEGVYSCGAEVDGNEYKGMMFIGQNHFNPEQKLSVEVNLFDFDRDIYDQTLFCYPELYIRENRKYDRTDDLVRQIAKDKENIMKLFDRGDNNNGN
jgi:riboflavin kinase/FMN adenylyltransferase